MECLNGTLLPCASPADVPIVPMHASWTNDPACQCHHQLIFALTLFINCTPPECSTEPFHPIAGKGRRCQLVNFKLVTAAAPRSQGCMQYIATPFHVACRPTIDSPSCTPYGDLRPRLSASSLCQPITTTTALDLVGSTGRVTWAAAQTQASASVHAPHLRL